MGELLYRLMYVAEVGKAVVGAVVGTISVCGLVADLWGAVGWMVSVGSVVHLFCARRRRLDRPAAAEESQPPPLPLRLLLASIAVFCLIFLTAMATACLGNPRMFGPVEKALVPILLTVGALSSGLAMRLTWK